MKKTTLYIIFSILTAYSFASNWVEEQKITSDEEGAGDWFGKAFDVQDGFLFVGDQSSARGHLEVKMKDSLGIWGTVQTIHPPQIGADFQYYIEDFGSFIDVNGDFLVVGAPKTDFGQPFTMDAGLVFIYKKNNAGIWELLQYLVSPEPLTSDDYFGANFIVEDSILAVAKRNYISEDGAGAAFVYEMDNTGMFQFQQKLEGSGIEHWDVFAMNLMIANDFIIVGSGFESQFARQSQDGDLSGGAYVFKKDSLGTWVQTQHILAPTKNLGVRFGCSLAAKDSNLFIGARQETVNRIVTQAGAVYHYTLNDTGAWVFSSQIIPAVPQQNAEFGTSISLTDDRLIVSAPKESDAETGNSGFIYSFVKSGNESFTFEVAFSTENSSNNDRFASVVRVDGDEVFAGPYSGHVNRGEVSNTEAGSIFHFTLAPESVSSSYIEKEENKFIVYPNPNSSGVVFLELNDIAEGGSIRVFDLEGKLIDELIHGMNEITTLKLNEGIYFVQFSNANFQGVQKLIVTKN